MYKAFLFLLIFHQAPPLYFLRWCIYNIHVMLYNAPSRSFNQLSLENVHHVVTYPPHYLTVHPTSVSVPWWRSYVLSPCKTYTWRDSPWLTLNTLLTRHLSVNAIVSVNKRKNIDRFFSFFFKCQRPSFALLVFYNLNNWRLRLDFGRFNFDRKPVLH